MIIYKYAPYFKSRLTDLQNNKLWLSLPESFNDPFDCDHPIETEMPHSERLNVIARIESYNGAETLEKFPVDELAAFPDETKTLIEKDVAGYFRTLFMDIGICCFSRCWDSIAMWSHYANEHRGICLGYDTDDLRENAGYRLEPVVYQDDPPNIHAKDIAYDFNTTADRYVFTKKTDWKYEKEMRLRSLTRGGGLVDSPLPLRSVIFGVRADEKPEADIKEALKNQCVSFFRIKRNERTFELIKEEC